MTQLIKRTTLSGVADINLYSEFAITMTGPALGLLFIYLGYRGRLLCVRRSITKPTDPEKTDAEQGHDAPSGTNDEQYALAARRTRDLTVHKRVLNCRSFTRSKPTLVFLRRSGSPSAGCSSSTPSCAGPPSVASRARTSTMARIAVGKREEPFSCGHSFPPQTLR
jgi:hypothetical protein